MRKALAGLAILAAAAVSAAAAPVHAADHQYFAISSNDAIAAVVDLSARSRSGDIVSFDLILLRRQPVKIGGLDAYWADGVQEFDCAGHRSRTMLIAGLTLDRGQKANQPGAGFQAWTANTPGTAIRAAEDFVCRNIAGPGIRPVADLGAFQRNYFRAAAAAPPVAAARPSPPPPPSTKSTAPSVATAPYYLVGRIDQGALFLQPSEQVTNEGLVTVLVKVLLAKPTPMEGGVQAAWGDGLGMFDCNQHRWRYANTRLMDFNRTRFAASPDGKYGPWTPIAPGSPLAAGEGLMCHDRMASSLLPVIDLVATGRQVQAADSRSAALGGQPRYLVTAYDKGSVFILDRAQVGRTGDIARSVNYRLSSKPSRAGGIDTYWSEAIKEHDCAQHRVRLNLVASMSLDRRNRVLMPAGSTFDPWERVNPNTDESDMEALVCTGKLGPFMTAASNDLDQLQRAYFAFAANSEPKFIFGSGAQPPSAASRVPPFVIASYDKQSAEIIDRRSIKRTGTIAAADAWLFRTDPSKLGGVAYHWTERTMEIDCAKHQYRRKIVAAHTVDFAQNANLPAMTFSAWEANDGKMDDDNAAILCEGRVAPEMPLANALTEFVPAFQAYARGSSPTLALATAGRATPQRPAAPDSPPARSTAPARPQASRPAP